MSANELHFLTKKLWLEIFDIINIAFMKCIW